MTELHRSRSDRNPSVSSAETLAGPAFGHDGDVELTRMCAARFSAVVLSSAHIFLSIRPARESSNIGRPASVHEASPRDDSQHQHRRRRAPPGTVPGFHPTEEMWQDVLNRRASRAPTLVPVRRPSSRLSHADTVAERDRREKRRRRTMWWMLGFTTAAACPLVIEGF